MDTFLKTYCDILEDFLFEDHEYGLSSEIGALQALLEKGEQELATGVLAKIEDIGSKSLLANYSETGAKIASDLHLHKYMGAGIGHILRSIIENNASDTPKAARMIAHYAEDRQKFVDLSILSLKKTMEKL